MSRAFLGHIATLVSGLIFGFGLAWSTMIRPESILAFLRFQDLGLLLVLGSAVGLNLLVFQLLPRLTRHPAFASAYQQRPFTLDRPALAGLGAGNGDMLIALAAIFAGAGLHGLWAGRQGQ